MLNNLVIIVNLLALIWRLGTDKYQSKSFRVHYLFRKGISGNFKDIYTTNFNLLYAQGKSSTICKLHNDNQCTVQMVAPVTVCDQLSGARLSRWLPYTFSDHSPPWRGATGCWSVNYTSLSQLGSVRQGSELDAWKSTTVFWLEEN